MSDIVDINRFEHLEIWFVCGSQDLYGPQALAQVIKEGSADGAMPPYHYLSDRDREDLAAFVLSLAPAPSP